MCGINGFNFEDEQLLSSMNKAIQHRGPDGEGSFCNKVSLGHRRLAIIDLSKRGKQPMSNEDGTIWITFNGEIYNFMEIKAQLVKKHTFKSDTDTEVIIHAYEEWGEECVKKFNGMWAFCIYDQKRNSFFLSRDRFGKKPLYYYNQGDKFIFSSEIKAILQHTIKKELNKTALSSYLSYRYVLGEETFFKDILKLMPAHNLIYDLGEKKIKRHGAYWDIIFDEINSTKENIEHELDRLLNNSIAYRKISDVPLGVILSGGLDSSLVTAMLAKQEKRPINTFTVKFRETGFDETEFAKRVSDKYKTKYFEVTLDTSNFLDIMREYIKFKDEPIGVPNEIPLYLLSKKIKENVTVVLSGEGADEIFEGYGRIFSSTRDYEMLSKIKNLPKANEVYKNQFSSLYKKYNGQLFDSELSHFLFLYNYFSKEEVKSLLIKDAIKDYSHFFAKYFKNINADYGHKISYVFIKAHLPGLLNRLDSPTMANAVEGRAPFLDYLLAQYSFNLSSGYKTKWLLDDKSLWLLNKNCDEMSEIDNISKYILKEVSKKYLPNEIISRKKQGFPLPLEEWFNNNFKSIAQDLILGADSKVRNFIKKEVVEAWIKAGKGNLFGQKLWMLLSLELWLREWFPDI